MRRESIHAFLFALCSALPCTTSTAAAGEGVTSHLGVSIGVRLAHTVALVVDPSPPVARSAENPAGSSQVPRKPLRSVDKRRLRGCHFEAEALAASAVVRCSWQPV